MEATPFDLNLLDPDHIVDVDIFSEETRRNWQALATDWAKRSPFYVINFGLPQVVTSRHADVRTVYMQTDVFTQRLPGGEVFYPEDKMGALPHLQKIDGTAHRRLRTIFAPWFGAAGVDRFEPVIKEEVKQLVDELQAQGNEVDIVSQFSNKLMPRILLARLFGLNEEQQQAFLRLRAERDVLASVSGFPPSYVEAVDRALAVVNEMIAEREASPRDDFIGGLVAAHARGEPISYDEITGTLFLLFFGALMTTSIEATVLLFNRMRYRDQFELLHTEPELIWPAIEESLRLHPAGLVAAVRFATRDTEIGGTKIWQGMPVHTAVGAANLDPTVYPDPLRFDIRRDPKQILTFGTGPHYCIGGILAQRIMAISLREFMQRFPDMQLIDPDFEFKYYGQVAELSPVEMRVRLN